MKKGFTLIELLVVVLIIGILASVALPQYQLAVDKSRMAGAVSLASSLRKGQEVYYMSNGMYTVNLEDLDIDLSSNCTRLGDGMIQCPMFVVDNIYGNLGASLAVNQAAVSFIPSGSMEQREAIVHVYYEHSSKPNQITCKGFTARGKKLCKSLGYAEEE